MTSFDKSADLSGWADKYIRNPINSWLDKRVREPVQEGFVRPMQEQAVQPVRRAVEAGKESIRSAANPLAIPGHIGSEFGKGYQGFYKPESLDKIDSLRAAGMVAGGVASEFGKGYTGFYKPETLDKLNPLRSDGMLAAAIASEFGKGYTGFYKPETLDKLNPLRATGMVTAGIGDRWAHDYSTNADGTPNTNMPTFWSRAADTGRNMVRNLSFSSDMPGTTKLPAIGEINNSTIANVAALPASTVMYSDMLLPKGWTSKAIPKINAKKPVPIANMSDAKRYRMLKKLRQRKAQLVKEQYSPTKLRKEYQALEQDPENYISFNAYYDKRKPELDALYAKKMNEISDAEEQLYPWLGGKQFGSKRRPNVVRTGTGTHRNPSGDFDYYGAWMDTGEKFGSDPDALIWRNIGRYGHMFPRFLMRTHRDGRWNTAKEQAQSFATDAVGDYLSNFLTWSITDETLPVLGSRIHPALGAFFRRNASGLRTGLNTYLMGANQRDALQSAIGKAPEEYIPMPNFRSYFSKKLHDAANSIPTLNDVMNAINTLPSPEDAENQGVYVPGRVNSTVQ